LRFSEGKWRRKPRSKSCNLPKASTFAPSPRAPVAGALFYRVIVLLRAYTENFAPTQSRGRYPIILNRLPSASRNSVSAAEHRRFPLENRQSRTGPTPYSRLAAARSRRGSDSPPDCHSIPRRRFAFSLRLGHAAGLTVPRTVIQYRGAASLPVNREGILKCTNIFV
jgi:hypothetical protein